MNGDLHTTNVILAIMAVVAVVEGLLLVAAGVALVAGYRRVVTLLDRLAPLAEDLVLRQLPPVVTRVNAILDDIKSVSAVVKEDTAWADHSVRATINHIDDIRSNVRTKTRSLGTVFRALRFVVSAVAGR
jgi:hypothetical protein